MKPILFNQEMVKAILDGRKSVRRRLVKFEKGFNNDPNIVYQGKCELGVGLFNEFNNVRVSKLPPYRVGDILYVRETYGIEDEYYIYKADLDDWSDINPKWKPSIHMPKEAARIFLRVTDVRVERLQDIEEEDAIKEGFSAGFSNVTSGPFGNDDDPDVWTARESFSEMWDNTVDKKELDRYGWNANPWVWVIEFERISKEDAYARD